MKSIVQRLCQYFLPAILLVTAMVHCHAQVKKFPADVFPVIGMPYSIFISDYMAPGSSALQANIVFNDFNEPSWTFRLRVKIEGTNLRMETRNDFRPPQPLVLTPGVMRTFSGVDWEPYLNYNNLDIAGISLNSLVTSGGKLPDGLYKFCFQVLDYDTGDPLSEEVCRTAYLKQVDAPRVNLPLCGQRLPTNTLQHAFTWQSFDTPAPGSEAPDFQLTIWEVTDPTANVQTAVRNGQALQIFQSPLTKLPTYSYGPSDPPLEVGKQYVFRVQSIDPQGKDKYKNQGYSEFCNFYYGWPIGGIVGLQFPAEAGGFRKKNIPYFTFSTVSPKLPDQMVNYEITITPWRDGQTREQAIQTNPPWFQFTTPPTNSSWPQSKVVDQRLEVVTKYAWQVRAFTEQVEVGKSQVGYFNGPALMEEFWAGGHRVQVDYLDGVNLDDISGEGRIRFSADPNVWTPVKFSHIRIADMAGFYKMTGGEFFHTPAQQLTLPLAATTRENGQAFYDVIRFRVNADGIYTEGSVRWPLPFPSMASGVVNVKSEVDWANFNDFTVNAVIRLAGGNQFDLLEPMDFSLDLETTSLIYVSRSQYRFELNGNVKLPQRVKGIDASAVRLPFYAKPQLFYIRQDNISEHQHAIAPLQNASLQLIAQDYTLDLSETQSPPKFATNARWKGVYFDGFDLTLPIAVDRKGQFGMVSDFTGSFTQIQTPSTDAWVTSTGLDFKIDWIIADTARMKFQTFPSDLVQLKLHTNQSQIVSENSFLKGKFFLPVVSTEKQFRFHVPITNVGFQDGYLEDLANTSFVHNPGAGDEEIKIRIKRAVLTAYEKITMTIDLEWPSMGVVLEDLRGFHAWGDYSIGFDNRNGTVPLVRRYNAVLSNYPITIGVIGAATNNGNYVFATTADAGLGDDVSGAEGAPSINVYSVCANRFVPLEAEGQVTASVTDQVPFEQASNQTAQQFDELQKSLTQKLDVDQKKLLAQAEKLKESLAGSPSTEAHTPEEIVGGSTESYPAEIGQGEGPQTRGRFNERQKEIIHDIAQGFIEELARPVLQPLKNKTDSIGIALQAKVDTLIERTCRTIRANVQTIVNGVAQPIAGALRNDRVDVETPIRQIADATTNTIVLEIRAAMQQSARTNIVEPVNVLLRDKIYGRINKHIVENGSNATYFAIIGEKDSARIAFERIVSGAPSLIRTVMRDAMAFVSAENLRSTIERTGADLVNNISVSRIGHDLRVQAEDILRNAINKELNEAVSNLAAKYADDLGLGGFGIGGENPINFVGVAQRFRDGGIKGVFSIDPVPVKLRTPVIDLDGFMKYTPQHPVYGDVWLGDINMKIKVPKKFAFNAIYFNGKKGDVHYWFCQITPPEASNKAYELGKPLPKRAKPLPEPVDIGLAKIVGASGRLYHHMVETTGNGIVPDASMRYGAYMHFVFFDKGSSGKNLRLEVSGEINSRENGDYTIAFDGNLQVRSGAPQVLEIDNTAVVQGTVMIRYNSAEEHFLGYAKVIVNKPGSLCAQASLLVDVKPGKWRVAIGTREDRIIFVPGCVGWSPTGWLDINQSEAELGLGVQYSGKAESPTINIGIAKAKVGIDAGFAFGIVAAIQYNPSFALMRAGVWLDLWCNIVAHYKLGVGEWKSITLVEIYLRGDLVMIFNPPPTVLEGTLDGHVKIVVFSFNFSAHMRKEL